MTTSTTRTTRTVLVMLGFGLAAGLAARATLAHDGDRDGRHDRFDERTIKGDWGFVTTVGTLLPPAAPTPVPTAGIGRVHFDGEGGCTVASTAVLEGRVLSLRSSSCHYRVNPDGTGSSEAVFPDAPTTEPFPVAFIITDGGREIFFTNTRFLLSTFVGHRQ